MNEAPQASVAEGQPADLVLLSANPLENIENVRLVEGVIIRGSWHSRAEIWAQMGSTDLEQGALVNYCLFFLYARDRPQGLAGYLERIGVSGAAQVSADILRVYGGDENPSPPTLSNQETPRGGPPSYSSLRNAVPGPVATTGRVPLGISAFD